MKILLSLMAVGIMASGGLAADNQTESPAAMLAAAKSPAPEVGDHPILNTGTQALRYFRVGGTGLIPRNTVTVTYNSVNCVSLSGVQFMHAPVHIPDGSIIKTVRVEYVDTSATAAVRGFVSRYQPQGGGGFADLAGAPGDVAFAGGIGTSTSPEIQEIVDNQNYVYNLLAIPGVADATNQVCGMTLAYYPPPEGRFVPISPCRLVDTRGGAPVAGGKFAAGEVRSYALNGVTATCNTIPVATGTPAIHGVKAYAVNLTVTQPDGPGFISAFPSGPLPSPLTSILNYVAGQTVANAANVPARLDGSIDVVAGGAGTHLVIDVVGYFF